MEPRPWQGGEPGVVTMFGRRASPEPGPVPARAPTRKAKISGWVLAAVLAAGWGAGSALWTPRGPLTAGEAIWSTAISIAVGLGSGALTRSRLAAALAPVVFVLALELTRMDIVGPSVDRPHASLYGAIVLVLGRGVHAVYTVVPLVLGAILGAAARRQGATTGARARWVRRTGTVLTGVLLVAAVAVTTRPARTAAIPASPGAAGESIAELTTVRAGGHELGLMLRGRHAHAPVLLYLAGGPGGSERGAMRIDPALEELFVVATWDQRGAGSSYRALDPTDTLTFEAALSDTIEVSEQLRDRFRQERIYVVGQSYGSLLAVLAAHRRPDLYHAVIGTGQMVSVVETDRMFYADSLAWARRTGREDLLVELERLGEPPYPNLLDYETVISLEPQVNAYDHSPNAEGPGGFSEHIFAQEYTPLQRLHNLPAALDTFSVLYPQIQGVDLRADVPRLAVPLVLVQGRFEARGRAELAREWFAMVQAPRKAWVELGTSGHRPIFQQPQEFAAAMNEHVLRPGRP